MSDVFCTLGVDPGVHGAIAFHFAPNDVVSVEDIPIIDNRVNGARLCDRLEQMRPDAAIIEMVSAMPGQGLSSTFKFGVAFGNIVGVLQGLRIPLHFVSPAKWKRAYGLGADKEASRRRAVELYPSLSERLAHKKDHNRAEAALIAAYGSRLIRREAAE